MINLFEPTPIQTTLVQKHIHFNEVNEVQTVGSEELTDGHIDMSNHSIEMPFQSIPLIHFNQFEEFEEEKQVEKVV